MVTCRRGMRDGVCGYNAGDAMNLSEIIPLVVVFAMYTTRLLVHFGCWFGGLKNC